MQRDKLREVERRIQEEQDKLFSQPDLSEDPAWAQKCDYIKDIYNHPGIDIVKELVDEGIETAKNQLTFVSGVREVAVLQGFVGALRTLWDDIETMAHFEEEKKDEFIEVQ